jgi:glycerol-3-phosphate acyltransferase PlsY
LNPVLLVLLSYLLGAIPTSHWVGRAIYDIDLRQHGSGNLGATNVYRVLGWKAALPVMLVDVGKGFVPAWLFPRIDAAPWSWALAYGTAAVLGHVYSMWVGFKGGKGVATSGGVLLGLVVSLGSILAAVSVPIALLFLPGDGGRPLLGFTTALAAFVIWAHRANIGRLARGEEHRFGRGPGRHVVPPVEHER